MAKLDELKKHLTRGKVCRRSDLAKWSESVRVLDYVTSKRDLVYEGIHRFEIMGNSIHFQRVIHSMRELFIFEN